VIAPAYIARTEQATRDTQSLGASRDDEKSWLFAEPAILAIIPILNKVRMSLPCFCPTIEVPGASNDDGVVENGDFQCFYRSLCLRNL